MTFQIKRIDGSYNGLASKIRFIKNCYRTSLEEPLVRRRAEEAAGRGERAVQAKNLFDWIRAHLAYTRDPIGVEMTKSPAVMVQQITSKGQAYGDCDDHACLGYAMLKSIGIPVKLRVAWYNKAMPQHIYLLAQFKDRWYPFDTTRKQGFGEEPKPAKVLDF
jgi:transglutaminase-like putative cysteine protease